MKIREILTKDNIECLNCNCQLPKRSVTEPDFIVPIYKCTTCECIFNEEHIIKKKFSKSYALQRYLK